MTLRGLRAVLAVVVATAAMTFAPVLGLTPASWVSNYWGPGEAWAQPAVAQKAIQEGDTFAKANKWAEALASYQKAMELNKSAGTAAKIANAQYKLGGKPVVTLEAYEKLLQDWSKTLSPTDKKTAQDRIKELTAKVGFLNIKVGEQGAAISVDGASVGNSPLAKPVRVDSGARKVTVTKEGFENFESSVDVAAKATVAVNVDLKEKPKVSKVTVTVKGGETLTISVDGQDVGTSPWEGTLPPGPHKIAGRSASLRTMEIAVDVKLGTPSAVELVASRAQGTLEVRVEVPKAVVMVDNQKVGDGGFRGEVAEGDHELKVTADGYEPFIKTIKIVSGEVVAETVALRKSTAGTVVEPIKEPWSFNGLYGGFEFIGMFEPSGNGNTMQSSCEVTGATSCDGGNPMGGAVGGYIGWAFAPVGLELFLLGGGDAAFPNASFDGVTSTEVNPLVGKPAREEDFTIGRFGGGAALRLRLLFPFGDRFRLTPAIGAGVAYRHMLLRRDTLAADGATSSVGNGDGDGYVTGVLSVDVGGQVVMAGTASFTFGFNLWLEHAGNGVESPGRGDILLTGGESDVPQPQATPTYDMAAGTQVFIGPYLGFHFGP